MALLARARRLGRRAPLDRARPRRPRRRRRVASSPARSTPPARSPPNRATTKRRADARRRTRALAHARRPGGHGANAEPSRRAGAQPLRLRRGARPAQRGARAPPTEANDDRHRAIALRNLGLLAAQQSDQETAGPLYEPALELARVEGDKRVIATLTHIAVARRVRGRQPRGRPRARRRRPRAGPRPRRPPDGRRTPHGARRTCDRRRRRAPPLTPGSRRRSTLWHRLGSPNAVAWLHTTLGEMALTDGDAASARRHFDQAAEAWRDTGDKPALARALNLAGWAALEAERLRRRREDARRGGGARPRGRRRSDAVGHAAQPRRARPPHGRPPGARHFLDESLALARASGLAQPAVVADMEPGRARPRGGPTRRRRGTARPGRGARPKIGRAPRLADCREEAALIAEARGDLESAKRLNEEAEKLRAGARLPLTRPHPRARYRANDTPSSDVKHVASAKDGA